MSKVINNEETTAQHANNLQTRTALLELSISYLNSTLERINNRLEIVDDKMDKLLSKVGYGIFCVIALIFFKFAVSSIKLL